MRNCWRFSPRCVLVRGVAGCVRGHYESVALTAELRAPRFLTPQLMIWDNCAEVLERFKTTAGEKFRPIDLTYTPPFSHRYRVLFLVLGDGAALRYNPGDQSDFNMRV